MRKLAQQRAKHLAVSLLSAENQAYETQRKAANHGRCRRVARRTHRQDDGQIYSRRTRKTVSQCHEDHRRREEARTRQAFKISSNCSGSSPYPSARIDLTKSSSRGVSNIPRRTAISSFLRFIASASRGRRPRLFSSAITSRISSSFVPLAISEARNDSCYLLANQLNLLANPAIQLTAVNAGLYTVNSRWARFFAQRASSHSACTASQSGLPAGISEIRNRSGSL